MGAEEAAKKPNPALWGRSVGGFLDGNQPLEIDPPIFGDIIIEDPAGDGTIDKLPEDNEPGANAMAILEEFARAGEWGWIDKIKKLCEFVENQCLEDELAEFLAEGLDLDDHS